MSSGAGQASLSARSGGASVTVSGGLARGESVSAFACTLGWRARCDLSSEW
jgi:hypothetical protein